MSSPNLPPGNPPVPFEDLSDEELMGRVARQDDHAAYAELQWRWRYRLSGEPSAGRRLHRHCRSRLNNDDNLAEEAVQEAWYRVWLYRKSWRRRRRLIPGYRFCPWLYRIATNACHDARRGVERQPPPWPPEASDPRPGIDEIMERAAVLVSVYHGNTQPPSTTWPPADPEAAQRHQGCVRMHYWPESYRTAEMPGVELDEETHREIQSLLDAPPQAPEPSGPAAAYLCDGFRAPRLPVGEVANLNRVLIWTVYRAIKCYREVVATTYQRRNYD